jgi:retron-type reverse transcriptase
VTSAVKSLDASREFKREDFKLDIHEQSEGSETPLLFSLESGLREKIENDSELVIKKDCFILKKSLRKELDRLVYSETHKLDMIVNLDENKRKEILIEKVQNRWNDKIRRFVNIHEVIFDPQTLIFAYVEMIKAKDVSIKKSADNIFDRRNLQRIMKDSQALLNKSWQPQKAKRVLIPRKNAEEFKVLTILSSSDKVVANAIKIVLNLIFEQHEGLNMLPKAKYLNKASHGFRSNKSSHSALNVIMTWKLSSWIIKTDIKKCYDMIDQKRLMCILNESIDDQKLVDTLYKFFNVLVEGFEKNNLNNNKGIGIPQNNQLSSILVNLYMNKFDYFIESATRNYSK